MLSFPDFVKGIRVNEPDVTQTCKRDRGTHDFSGRDTKREPEKYLAPRCILTQHWYYYIASWNQG